MCYLYSLKLTNEVELVSKPKLETFHKAFSVAILFAKFGDFCHTESSNFASIFFGIFGNGKIMHLSLTDGLMFRVCEDNFLNCVKSAVCQIS